MSDKTQPPAYSLSFLAGPRRTPLPKWGIGKVLYHAQTEGGRFAGWCGKFKVEEIRIRANAVLYFGGGKGFEEHLLEPDYEAAFRRFNKGEETK